MSGLSQEDGRLFDVLRHDLVCLLCTLMATEPCIASAARMKARLVSFGFGLLFQLQDARS